MSAHTPGPWKLAGRAMVFTADDEQIADCEPPAPYIPRTVDFANARLIAAAPDLLDAARLIDQADGLADSRDDHEQKMVVALRAIRAAIAKAEGRE